MIANPSFDVNSFAKRFEASGQKVEGLGGRKLFARERNQTEAAPAACSFSAEPSKILFSFLEEFFGGVRKSKIVKSILLGGER